MHLSNWIPNRADRLPGHARRQSLHSSQCACRRCEPLVPADRPRVSGVRLALAGIVAGVLVVALGGAPALVLIFRSF